MKKTKEKSKEFRSKNRRSKAEGQGLEGQKLLGQVIEGQKISGQNTFFERVVVEPVVLLVFIRGGHQLSQRKTLCLSFFRILSSKTVAKNPTTTESQWSLRAPSLYGV